jgi:hypothetical protein
MYMRVRGLAKYYRKSPDTLSEQEVQKTSSSCWAI